MGKKYIGCWICKCQPADLQLNVFLDCFFLTKTPLLIVVCGLRVGTHLIFIFALHLKGLHSKCNRRNNRFAWNFEKLVFKACLRQATLVKSIDLQL